MVHRSPDGRIRWRSRGGLLVTVSRSLHRAGFWGGESGAAGAASAAADTIDLSAGVGDGDGGGGGSIAAMGDSGRFMFGDGCQTPALADRTDVKAEERKV